MSCVCETIQLLSVVFFLVRAVHMKHKRIGDGLKEVYAVMETQVHRRIYMLTPPPTSGGSVCCLRVVIRSSKMEHDVEATLC